jgi:hypothetical protein
MKAKSYIQYKTNGNLVTETLWVQNVNSSRVENGHLMLLLGTEDDGSPRITTNQDNVEQYVFNELVIDGAYVFVSIDQAKVLKALKMVRNVDGDIWLKLPIHFNVPASIFNSAPIWE